MTYRLSSISGESNASWYTNVWAEAWRRSREVGNREFNQAFVAYACLIHASGGELENRNIGSGSILFEKESDMTMFILKWSS